LLEGRIFLGTTEGILDQVDENINSLVRMNIGLYIEVLVLEGQLAKVLVNLADVQSC